MSKIHEIINKSSNDDLLDNEKNFSYDEKQRISYDNFYISKITMKDGTVYDANEFNNSSSSSFLKGYTSVEFNKVIDNTCIHMLSTFFLTIISLNTKKC